MATNFKLKRSAVASKRPGTTDLELGELALNTYDGFLYSETTGAGSTVSLLTPWQEKYGQGSIYYTGGSVGIGTTNPTTLTGPPSATVKLHIHDTLSPRIQFTDASTGGASGDGSILGINGEDDFFINNRESGKGIRFFTGNDERVSIASDGHVGIGSTLPTAELDVNGHAELDHVNVSGVTTHQDDVIINKDKDLIFDRFGVTKTRITYNDTLVVTQIKNVSENLEIGYRPTHLMWLTNSVLNTKLGGINVTGDAETDTLHVSGISEFTGIGTFLGGASLLDNDVLYFGGSAATGITTDYRLRIYSDGTDSYISEATGAGDLRLSSDSRVEIRNAALNHTVASFNTGVGVTVFDRFKVSGISSFTGNVDLGISTSTTITATSRFDSDLVPSTDVARDLGSSSLRWRTLYVSNLVVAPGGPGFAGSNLTVNNLKVIGISTFLDHADFDSVSIGSTLNVAGVSTFNANVHLLDDDKLQLGGTSGTVDGLELYHDSTQNHSYIDDTGSGNLKVRSNNLRISNGGETKVYATFKPSEVDLYADNSVRLTTSGSGVEVTGIITATTGHFDSVTGPSTITIDPATIGDNTGTVVIKGDLQVDGTTTTVNSTTLTVTDKNIEIAKGAGNDAAVDGAGITVDSTQGDKTWNWVDATDAWTSSEHIHVAAGKRLGFADDDNTFIDRPRADTIEFTTGGAERVSITGIGSVGVGITNPHVPLHIETPTTGAITSLLKLHGPFTSNTGSEGTAIDFGTAADVSVGARIIGTREAAGAKGALRFCTGRENDSGFNDGHMVIDETGNVGIGSASPAVLLNLMSSNPLIRLTDSDNGGYSALGGEGGNLYLYTNSTSRDFIFRGSQEVARLTGDGNLGIGTNNPLNPLEVWGSSADVLICDTDDYSENSSGAAVSLQGHDSTGIRKTLADIRGVAKGANIGEFAIRTRQSGGNLTEAVRVDSVGRVGIGSVTPDAKLSVVGVGTFKEDVYVDKKLYVGGIEIIGPGTGIGTDITTRHLRATGITTTEQLLDADGGADIAGITTVSGLLDANGGADIAGITTAALLDVGNLTNGRVAYVGSNSGRLVDSGNLTFDGSTLLVTGTLNSTVDVQINGTSVVDSALNDAVAMAIALG